MKPPTTKCPSTQPTPSKRPKGARWGTSWNVLYKKNWLIDCIGVETCSRKTYQTSGCRWLKPVVEDMIQMTGNIHRHIWHKCPYGWKSIGCSRTSQKQAKLKSDINSASAHREARFTLKVTKRLPDKKRS